MAQPVVAAVMFAATGLTPVEAESPNAERIEDLYWFVSFWAALVLLAVAVPLAIFVIRYRSRGRDRTIEGPQIHGSTKLEIAWTLVPVVILLFVVAFTFYKLPGITLEDEAQAGDLRIRVEGRQFYWQYRYPNGVIAIDRLVAPVDRLVRPRDHGTGERRHPQLLGPRASEASSTRFPGKTVQTGFQADEAGIFEGQCAEFCGIQHARCSRRSRCCRAEEFDSWLDDQARRQEPAPPTSASRSSRAPARSATARKGRG